MQVIEAIAALLLIYVAAVGIYVTQRYGLDGASFCWSKDFPRALHDWKTRQLEKQEQAEVEARAREEDVRKQAA